MSPAAKETRLAAPFTRNVENQLLMAVVSRKMTAHDAAKCLIPYYMDRKDSAVQKLTQATVEHFEFYRDLVYTEGRHDLESFNETCRLLRSAWDRE